MSSWVSREACDEWRASWEETRRRAAMAPYVLSEQDGYYRGRELIVAGAAVSSQAGFTAIDDLAHGFGGGYLPPVVPAPGRAGLQTGELPCHHENACRTAVIGAPNAPIDANPRGLLFGCDHEQVSHGFNVVCPRHLEAIAAGSRGCEFDGTWPVLGWERSRDSTSGISWPSDPFERGKKVARRLRGQHTGPQLRAARVGIFEVERQRDRGTCPKSSESSAGRPAAHLGENGVGILQACMSRTGVHCVGILLHLHLLGKCRNTRHGSIALQVFPLVAAEHRQTPLTPDSGLVRWLVDADDRADLVAVLAEAGIIVVPVYGIFDLAVKGTGGGHLARIKSGNEARCLGEADEVPVAAVEAAVDGQQLVDRREGAQEIGKVSQAQHAGQAVGQEIKGLYRPAVGSAEREEGTGVAPAAKNLQVIPGDQAAHRMCDEDQARIRVRGPPRPQPRLRLGGELPGGYPIVAAPVIGEFEVTFAW